MFASDEMFVRPLIFRFSRRVMNWMLHGARKETKMSTETTDKAATVAEPGAAVAPEKAPSEEGCQPEEECAQGQENR